MHHRDLPGRAAERQAADLEPDLEGLVEGRRGRLGGSGLIHRRHGLSSRLGRPVVTFLRGKTNIGEQPVVDLERCRRSSHDRRRRPAPISRAIWRAGPRLPARDRAAPCRRRGRSAQAAPATARLRARTASAWCRTSSARPRGKFPRPRCRTGSAPVSLAAPELIRDRRTRIRACGSMKRRISHGQATRSIFGRRRVTHRLGRRGAKPVERGFVDQRQAGLDPCRIAAGQHAGVEAFARANKRPVPGSVWCAQLAGRTRRAACGRAVGRPCVRPARSRARLRSAERRSMTRRHRTGARRRVAAPRAGADQRPQIAR